MSENRKMSMSQVVSLSSVSRKKLALFRKLFVDSFKDAFCCWQAVVLLFVNDLVLPWDRLSICSTFQMMRKYKTIF